MRGSGVGGRGVAPERNNGEMMENQEREGGREGGRKWWDE